MHEQEIANTITKSPFLDMTKWQSILADWESSKESQKAYCQRLGLNLHTFSYARSKLKKDNTLKPTFIPIAVSSSEDKKNRNINMITLENPQGLKIHFPYLLSSEQLSRILTLCGWYHA